MRSSINGYGLRGPELGGQRLREGLCQQYIWVSFLYIAVLRLIPTLLFFCLRSPCISEGNSHLANALQCSPTSCIFTLQCLLFGTFTVFTQNTENQNNELKVAEIIFRVHIKSSPKISEKKVYFHVSYLILFIFHMLSSFIFSEKDNFPGSGSYKLQPLSCLTWDSFADEAKPLCAWWKAPSTINHPGSNTGICSQQLWVWAFVRPVGVLHWWTIHPGHGVS